MSEDSVPADAPARRRMTGVVAVCALASAVALWASGRTWATWDGPGPSTLPGGAASLTGAGTLPWLPATALVALAGAGALVAVPGLLRRVVGGVLVLIGVGFVAGPTTAVTEGAGPLWPVVVAACGAVVTACGVLAIREAGRWPGLGARYARDDGPAGAGTPTGDTRPGDSRGGAGDAAAWRALDRGEDPTV
ncbi:membrane protein [Pilimelia terevasa]|uniref:Membrane protein n=1 Tax=Pilimelia terevasa TaxID=53372 RepID=A0A8J3BJ39_9ACTN|nr:Trp biosynthesis-associated membrane protein [Pilimelia terevasa]GGK23069.1 membrane protein [Pilimelia terevasa]